MIHAYITKYIQNLLWCYRKMPKSWKKWTTRRWRRSRPSTWTPFRRYGPTPASRNATIEGESINLQIQPNSKLCRTTCTVHEDTWSPISEELLLCVVPSVCLSVWFFCFNFELLLEIVARPGHSTLDQQQKWDNWELISICPFIFSFVGL